MHIIWKLALVMLSLATAGMTLAQEPNPTVEIVLDPPTAAIGQTVTAEVIVRGAVNIAGTDIGITVDPTCLRVVERIPGEFLPTKSEEGGFSAFSELNDHDTRLAASLLRRSHIANGDGVFFRATLEVTCEEGIAPVEVSFVELTGIEDLEAENATFIVYKLDLGNVTTSSAQLTIAPAAQVTESATDVVTATATPTVSTDATPVPITETQAPQSNQAIMIVVILLVMGTLIGLILYGLARYRRNRR